MTKTSIGTTNAVDMAYVYWLSKRNTNGSDKYRTTKIKQETIGSEKFSYEYNSRGNITVIKKMSYNADGSEAGYTTPVAAYEYDELGQLVHETLGTGTEQKKYSYDAGGNLLTETLEIWSGGRVISSTVTNYGYEDSNWKDKLTSYGGKAITYDEIGNPLSYRGMTMAWQNGRQLASLQKGSTAVSYTYDANSTRATKTVNGVKYTYQYVGGKLIHETRGEKSFHYYYDANGYLTAIKYRLTPNGQDFAYYATHNWRGDVIGLYNGDGELRAKYEYDTWGKVTSVKDANGTRITDQNHVGNLNPFRYRGYYYDTESQLYYLMTRYYDPVVHRFINADGYFQTGTGILDKNMNTYCMNNPVNCYDPTGGRCHALDGGRQGAMCPTDFRTGYCPVCHKQECCLPAATLTSNPNPSVDWFSGSNIYSAAITTLDTGIATGSSMMIQDIQNVVRPKNIGAGTWAKQIASETSTVLSFASKSHVAFEVLSYGGVAIDTGIGVVNNLQNNASAGKIAYDAVVDISISAINITESIAVSTAVGAVLGSAFPVVGNIIGGVIGFGFGIAMFYLTDGVQVGGTTMRQGIKNLYQ